MPPALPCPASVPQPPHARFQVNDAVQFVDAEIFCWDQQKQKLQEEEACVRRPAQPTPAHLIQKDVPRKLAHSDVLAQPRGGRRELLHECVCGGVRM